MVAQRNFLKQRIQKIKLLVMDVDGVLTDGKIIYNSEGQEIKHFDVQDGYGIVFFQRAGFKTAIITARSSRVVTIRAEDLEISKVYQDASPKINAYKELLNDFNLKDEEVCFMGDDLVDIPILKKVGFAVGVPNAVAEVKKNVHYVTKKNGGYGAVREVIELILKTQGMWESILAGVES